MATASNAVYARLSGFAGLAALVGTRIYPGRVPQDAVLPFVSYVRIDEDGEEAMGDDADHDETLFEVASIGASYDSAESVHEQVRGALRRFRGSYGAVTVHDCLFRGGEGPVFLDDPAQFEATQRVALRYTRP